MSIATSGEEPAPSDKDDWKKMFLQQIMEFRKLASARLNRELGESWQTTALVDATWLKFAQNPHQQFENPGHFFAAAAKAMQQNLIDSARNRNRQKRGEGEKSVPIHLIDEASIQVVNLFDLHQSMMLNEALDLLAKDHPEACFALALEFFYGMNQAEVQRKPQRAAPHNCRDRGFERDQTERSQVDQAISVESNTLFKRQVLVEDSLR